MKLKYTVLAALALASTAGATTITGSGGTAGAQFITSTGVFLTPTNATVQVGTFNSTTNLFTQFAAADATPIAFSAAASLTGRWVGGYGDTGVTANEFNGQPLWVRISVNLGGGVTGLSFFSTNVNFPANGGGVGDNLNLLGSNLTGVDQDAGLAAQSSVPFAAAAGSFTTGSVVVGVVPEPSTALLGLLGIAGLIRRRR